MKILFIQLTLLVFCFCFSISSLWSYDGALSKYLSPVAPEANTLIAYKKSKGDKSDPHSLWADDRQSLLFSSSPKRQLYGIYFCNLNGRKESFYNPAFQWFTDFDIRTLEQLDIYILELHDAKVLTTDYDIIKSMPTLRILGLPNTGTEFSKVESLPPMIEILVVRNARLDGDFFRVVNQLTKLESLILYNCYLDYEMPKTREHLFHQDSWNGFPPLFEMLSGRLRNLEIIKSDTAIFEHAVRYQWNSLDSLTVITSPLRIDIAFSQCERINETNHSNGEYAYIFPNLRRLKFNEKKSLVLIRKLQLERLFGQQLEGIKIDIIAVR